MKISSVLSRPSSRSITQSTTGRPATLSSGLGTRRVGGRRRVPFPARGMITCISTSSVAVLEAYQIIQLGRRGLEHVAVHNRLDLVDQPGRDMHALTRPERTGNGSVTLPGAELELAP